MPSPHESEPEYEEQLRLVDEAFDRARADGVEILDDRDGETEVRFIESGARFAALREAFDRNSFGGAVIVPEPESPKPS